MNLNQVIISGHLVRDAELRYTPQGTAIGNATIALNRKWKDKTTGEEKEEVSFIDVSAFGFNAAALGTMHKGQNALIIGRLKQDSWEDKKTGQKRTKVFVQAEAFPVVVSQVAVESGRPAPAKADDDSVPF